MLEGEKRQNPEHRYLLAIWLVRSTGIGHGLIFPFIYYFFSQDLSKKDSALLKLGSELKDLETVQEELEKKEQELRTERNTVTKVD